MSNDVLKDPVRHYRSIRVCRSITKDHRAWHILEDAQSASGYALGRQPVNFHQLGRIGSHICSRHVACDGDEDFLVSPDPNDEDYGALMDAQLLKLAVCSPEEEAVRKMLPPDLEAKVAAHYASQPPGGYDIPTLCQPYLRLCGRIPGLEYGWDVGEN